MNEAFETFAKKICEYCMTKYVLPWLRSHGAVQSYRAQVVSVNAANRTMVVQKPFDSEITLPYADAASGLSAGDECLVLVLGEGLNGIVVCDGAGRGL